MSGLHVLDVAAVADMAGLAAWHDPGQWHWAKLPFSQNLIPLYADHVARYIGALRGRSRKCLILDLDNTLWGGVIGDDGLEGIELGQGSTRGEAYLTVQRMARALRERGIVLAVCSKNDDANARLPFRLHPEQILKEEHIAVFQANWNDKASNLEAIIKALDLTPEALVFLDDNPAEREIIRRELPAVAVPEIPDDEPALWPQILSAAGYFEAISFTDADLDRAKQYATNAERETLKVKSRDIGDYLQALEMEMEVTPFDAPVAARVAQLINRSNQYNLTSRRYTEEQVIALNADSSVACFSVRLRDRFGDNGIISIVICRDDGHDWYIDTWLMSCRVLGRQVERALLNLFEVLTIKLTMLGVKVVYVDMPVPTYFRQGFFIYDDYRKKEKSIIEDHNVHYLDMTAFAPDDQFIDDAHPKPEYAQSWSEALARFLKSITVPRQALLDR